MIEQVYESFKSSFREMSKEEIVAQFDRYGFEDELGHPLRNCIPFLALVELALHGCD